MALNAFKFRHLSACIAAWAWSLALMAFFSYYSGFFGESALFLLGYLDYPGARDLAQIVLDIRQNDRLGYVGREPAYLMAFADARFARLCVQEGLPHFFSLTHALSLLAVAAIHGTFALRTLKSTPFSISLLLLLLFLSTPAATLSGGLFLPGQSVETVFLVLALWTLASLSRSGDRAWPAGAKMFLAVLPLPFFGPQGAFLLASMVGLAGLALLAGTRPPWLRGAWSALAVAGLLFAGYKLFLAPWLIVWASGYSPQSAARPFDAWGYVEGWGAFAFAGLQLLVETSGRFFGGWGRGAGIAFGLALFVPWFLKVRKGEQIPLPDRFPDTGRSMAWTMAGGILLLAFMNSLILFHRPDILQYASLKIVRYWMTAGGCFLVAASLSADRLIRSCPAARKPLAVALALLAVSNAFSIRASAREILKETNPSHANRSREAIRSLASPEKPLFRFNLDQSELDLTPPSPAFFPDPWSDWPVRDLRPVYRACRMLRAPAGYESSDYAGMERILAGQERFVTLEPLRPMPWEAMAEILAAGTKYHPRVIVAPLETPPALASGKAPGKTGIPLLDHVRNLSPGPAAVPPGKCAGWFVLTQDPVNKGVGLFVCLGAGGGDADRLKSFLNEKNIPCHVTGQDPFAKESLTSYADAGNAVGETLFLGLLACRAMLEAKIGYFEGAYDGMAELGRSLFSRGDYPNAALCLEIARAMGMAEASDVSMAGGIYHSLGHPSKARSLLMEAFDKRPDSVMVLNNLAWFLATTPDPALADGEKAAAIASALGETFPKNASIMDTLAAAQARTGRYAQAAKTARQSLHWAREQGDAAFISQIIHRLRLYEKETPYLERRSENGL